MRSAPSRAARAATVLVRLHNPAGKVVSELTLQTDCDLLRFLTFTFDAYTPGTPPNIRILKLRGACDEVPAALAHGGPATTPPAGHPTNLRVCMHHAPISRCLIPY